MQRTGVVPGSLARPIAITGLLVFVGTLLVERTLFDAVGGFSEDPRVQRRQDWELHLRLAMRADVLALDQALADMTTVYYDFYEPELGVREIPLHDPLAAAIAIGGLTPSDAPELPLRVDLEGAIEEDPSGARVRVVLALAEAGGPAILRRLLERNQ